MLNTEDFVNKLRDIIADNTSLSLTEIITPQLPQDGENICAVTLLGGNPSRNLCNVDYFLQTFRVIVRGTSNDTDTRRLADSIYNSLEGKKNVNFGEDNKIIDILANSTPIFVGKDENQRNLYNITFNCKIK